MSLRIALLTPRCRLIANRFGLGYQIPLGMVSLGGPLLDAGQHVRLLDNDMLGMDDERLRQLTGQPTADSEASKHHG